MPKHLLILIMTLSSVLASATDHWDKVLDRYEAICDQCIELRARIASGEAVPDKSVTALLGELGRLRSSLQEGTGNMTSAQRERFHRIRDRYLAASGARAPAGADSSGKTTAPPSQSTVKPAGRPRPHKPTAPAQTDTFARSTEPERIKIEPVNTVTAPFIPMSVNSSRTWQEGLSPHELKDIPVGPCPTPTRYSIMATYSFNGVSSAGLMGTVVRRKNGGYISVQTNFTSCAHAYDILSDGSLPDGGRFWSSGRDRLSTMRIMAGAIRSVLSTSRHGEISLYAGGGFGSETVLWQDSTGSWAKVSDASASGAALDAGVIWVLGHLSASLGAEWLAAKAGGASCCPGAVIGIGYRF